MTTSIFTEDNLCTSSSNFISDENVEQEYNRLCNSLSSVVYDPRNTQEMDQISPPRETQSDHQSTNTQSEKPPQDGSSSTRRETASFTPSINCDAESVASSQSSGADALHRIYRNKVLKFFGKKENYRRLEEFVTHRDTDVYSIFLHFIVRHCDSKFIHTIRSTDRETKKQSVYCPKHEYTRALRKYQKCYYNFEAKAGEGNLFWKGVCNPRFLVAPQYGSISLPIAKCIALYWAIDFGFDTVFWSKYNEIREQYRTFVRKTKLKYTETHKNKKKRIRKEEEDLLIEERKRKQEEELKQRLDQGLPPRKRTRRRKKDTSGVKSRQPTRLSRKERKVVVQRIKARNLKQAVAKREERQKTKRRKNYQTKAKRSFKIDVNEIEL